MSNEQGRPEQNGSATPEPWQGDWPGSGPAPTEGERTVVEQEMAEGKWSEPRQRGDWTAANHADIPADRPARDGDQANARDEAMSDIAKQVSEGTEEPG